MYSVFGFFTFIYFLAVAAIIVFSLYLILRLVKAVEKFADAYERKNS